MGKYDPLRDHLAAVPEGTLAVDLRLRDIERMCGPLPPSATRERTWWANSSHSQARAWRDAGWHVERVDFNSAIVRFARGKIGGTYAASRRKQRPTEAPPTRDVVDPGQSEGGIVGNVDVTIRFDWRQAGTVTVVADMLVFPRLATAPGLYRLQLDGGGRDLPHVYIGETGSLRQRMGHYRRPPAKAQTSIRINALLSEHLSIGGTITIAICTRATIAVRGVTRDADFSLKRERVLAEHAALAVDAEGAVVTLANL